MECAISGVLGRDGRLMDAAEWIPPSFEPHRGHILVVCEYPQVQAGGHGVPENIPSLPHAPSHVLGRPVRLPAAMELEGNVLTPCFLLAYQGPTHHYRPVDLKPRRFRGRCRCRCRPARHSGRRLLSFSVPSKPGSTRRRSEQSTLNTVPIRGLVPGHIHWYWLLRRGDGGGGAGPSRHP